MYTTLSQQLNTAQTAATSSSSAGASGCSNNNKVNLESKIQQLSERLQSLESQQQYVDRSHSGPSNATTTLLRPSSSSGLPFNNRESDSSTSSLSSQLTPTVTTREDISSMALRKLELCYRKAETYEGMAMVLNVSLDRLLTQVTEIDSQRRRESESREAQERKIQVGAGV